LRTRHRIPNLGRNRGGGGEVASFVSLLGSFRHIAQNSRAAGLSKSTFSSIAEGIVGMGTGSGILQSHPHECFGASERSEAGDAARKNGVKDVAQNFISLAKNRLASPCADYDHTDKGPRRFQKKTRNAVCTSPAVPCIGDLLNGRIEQSSSICGKKDCFQTHTLSARRPEKQTLERFSAKKSWRNRPRHLAIIGKAGLW